MTAFADPDEFVFVPALEAQFEEILLELHALGRERFVDAPDALSIPGRDYDERGWKYFSLFGNDPRCAGNRRACPLSARACMLVPGLLNAGFSLFLPGTRLAPHRGELTGTLRCHLPLIVPRGDVGIRSGDEVRRWERGRALVFDDSREHTAWNLADSERVLLLVTFLA